MKPETEKGLRDASTETIQDIVRLIAEITPSELIVAALLDADGDLTDDGRDIYHDMDKHVDHDPVIEDDTAARLHDATCEGRRQDAIDILNEVTGGNYRSVREQANLFPARVEA